VPIFEAETSFAASLSVREQPSMRKTLFVLEEKKIAPVKNVTSHCCTYNPASTT